MIKLCSSKESKLDVVPKDLLQYHVLHQLEVCKNYELTNGNDKDESNNEELVTYIHNNFDRMDEVEMGKLLLKCLGVNDIKKNLLAFEFKHYKRKTVPTMTLDHFEKIAFEIINRYQWKAGGYYIEDQEWTVHRPGSSEYDVKKNELLFENTIDKFDLDSEELDEFLSTLKEHLNSVAENITTDVRYKNELKKIIRILLWFEDKNIPHNCEEASDESVGL